MKRPVGGRVGIRMSMGENFEKLISGGSQLGTQEYYMHINIPFGIPWKSEKGELRIA